MSEEWLSSNLWWVIAVALWDLIWRGLALWKSARSGSKPWFVALMLINSGGLLPIAYILFLSKETSAVSSKS